MASGVSSMIRSQPVRVSMLRMLRPSRPMMRPGDGDLAGVVGGAALDGGGDDLSGPIVGLVLELGLQLLDLHGHLMGHIVPHGGDDVGLGLLHGEAGDLLQHLQLALLDQSHLGLLGLHRGDLVGQGLVLLFQGVGLAVQALLLLLKAALLLLQLGPTGLLLPLVLGAAFVYFFLCLYEGFSLFALCTLDRIIDDLLGFFLGVGDAALGILLPGHKKDGSAHSADHKPDNEPYDSRHSK